MAHTRRSLWNGGLLESRRDEGDDLVSKDDIAVVGDRVSYVSIHAAADAIGLLLNTSDHRTDISFWIDAHEHNQVYEELAAGGLRGSSASPCTTVDYCFALCSVTPMRTVTGHRRGGRGWNWQRRSATLTT